MSISTVSNTQENRKGEDGVEKQGRKSVVAYIKNYFKEYCNATAIHGVRYLAEDNRNIIER